jgi:hypothetical protein
MIDGFVANTLHIGIVIPFALASMAVIAETLINALAVANSTP